MIYLINQTGAATTNDDGMAHAMETIANYRRCTKAEYHEHLRKINAVDLPPTGIKIDIQPTGIKMDIQISKENQQ